MVRMKAHTHPKRLRVDGSGGCADGGARRALLGVGLHKMKCPKQVLWVAFLGEEGFSDEEIPNDLNGIDRSPKELAEVPRLPVGVPTARDILFWMSRASASQSTSSTSLLSSSSLSSLSTK